MTEKITDNTAQSRFELVVDGHVSYADYALKGDTLSIKYVFAPPELRGTGAASRLMDGITAIARARNVKILPICGYAVSWLRKHKDHHDLIAL